ncbi:MAG: electron transfer flavoprotein subunit beta/FixA family protein [Verrucomicrobia bacterium]|nr:electron transfer flavoprotein subunit beta/FixA family protein [Verrucomicrobiota bacterium]
MNLYVLLKMVPDTVEELNVAADGKSLDSEFLRFKLNDPDEHALEQALLLKEKHGGKVTVVTLDAPEVDDVLFTALAKGADRAVKLPVNQAELGTVAAARVLADFLKAEATPLPPDTLVLPGSYAIDDLEGELAPLLATALELPYVGVVCGIAPAEGKATVRKEFAGGLRGEFEVALPAVLGIQSADKPPRYVPVAKVRAAMKSARIETVDVPPPDRPRQLELERTYKPEAAGHAEMLEGSPEEVADRLVEILVKNSAI